MSVRLGTTVISGNLQAGGFVHTTGDEEITGVKKFYTAGGYPIELSHTTLEYNVIPQETLNLGYKFLDKNNNQVAKCEFNKKTDGSNEFTFNVLGTTGQWCDMPVGIGQTNTGTVYTYAPTPVTGSNDNSIVTTNWISDITKSTQLVHRDYQETISGEKTFSTAPKISAAQEPSTSTEDTTVATIGWINDSTKAMSLLHKTSTEYITGAKIFNVAPTMRNNLTPSTTTAKELPVEDILISHSLNTNGTFDGMSITRYQDTEGNREVQYCGGFRNSTDTDNIFPTLILGAKPDNTSYIKTNVTKPALDDNSKNLATTEWVNTASSVVHTSGNENITGTKTFSDTIQGTCYRALWADLAEKYEADEEYLPGTLLQVGGEKEVTKATTECNLIVSTNPGFILNNDKDKEGIWLPCTLSGRVPVLVDCEVVKGDKLYLSKNTPGYASNIENGLVIGIALNSTKNNLVEAIVKLSF